MQLRCYRCGWSFAIKRDEITFALEALEESDGSHYDVRCPRCRHTNRVAIEQLRRAVPRREQPESSEPEPAAGAEPAGSADGDPGQGDESQAGS